MARQRISLDGSWQFLSDPERRFRQDTVTQAGPLLRTIRVPGPWQAQFDDLRFYSGVAWYRREFSLPETEPFKADPKRTFLLHFGAVDYFASVWLNGQPIGEHEGGYLPFEINIDNVIKHSGTNELIVYVIDPGDNRDFLSQFSFSEIPHGKQSWYGPIGGIWQSVFIETRHSTYFTRLHITPDVKGEQARVELRLNQQISTPMSIKLQLTDPLNQITTHREDIEKNRDQFEIVLPVPNPLLWDTHSPNLYNLEVSLTEIGEETQLDSTTSHFGMRTISTSPEGHLMLNDRILYLRGALDQDYYPEMIYTPFSNAELEDQFVKAKHMGLNCLRTHIKITDPRYYDAADRAGILIWTELPNWENLTQIAKDRVRETLTGMVERDWNHPSIVIWTIVNEGWGVELAVNPDHRKWLSETYDYLKQLDPHRLVVGNSACFTNFHVVTDIEDFHNYYSIPDHYLHWREWVETFAARPSWSFAHSYENIDAWRDFMRDPWKPKPRTPAPEVRRKGSEPIVVSEFGNWGLPDLDKLRSSYGGRDPWWFETGIEWGEGAVYPHAIEQRYKTWHLDSVFPSLSKLAAASQRMQYCALKYQIEQMRRHPSIVGYIITEFTDVHWECNGLLDMCRNPKAFYNAMANINKADAIIPDWERIAFWEGELCELEIALSHFSYEELKDCRIEWYLEGFPEISGVFENLTPQIAKITNVGKITFMVPTLDESQRVRIELRCVNRDGNLITGNHQELYFFPKKHNTHTDAKILSPKHLVKPLKNLGYQIVKDINSADLIVVDKMTDEFRWYVQNGGRVLWLAESNKAQQTYLGTLEISPRQGRKWQGDWASNMNWLRQDDIFKQIPTGGLIDFAFADLTPEHVITGISPREFASDVHSGIFIGWIHHVAALIAERRYGNGRLLVSTFRLQDHLDSHPVASIMIHEMIRDLLKDSSASNKSI